MRVVVDGVPLLSRSQPPNPSVVPPSSNTLASVSRPAPRTSDSGTIASEIDINDLDIRYVCVCVCVCECVCVCV